MNMDSIMIPPDHLRRLLASASGDAALLYLYIYSGGAAEQAESALQMTASRYSCAAAVLRQLGLWPEEKRSHILSGERPNYSEKDVMDAMDTDGSFRLLYGEVQRLLGKGLNTEELKILLSFDRYLGLPTEVISILVSYCKDRARQRGSLRNPSLRTIEKEAYRWAEQGIDTLEEAAAYIHTQNTRDSKIGHLKHLLQIRGRRLTQAEERYAQSWLDMDLSDEVITMAYERTCINTGGLNWNYMNKILTSWHQAGLKTPDQIKSGDRKPGSRTGERKLDPEEQAAIARMLQEG